MIAFARTLIVFFLAVLAPRLSKASFIVCKPSAIWLRSIAGSISLLCTFFALTRMPLADALTLFHLSPLWIAVLSWMFLRYRLSGQDVVALALALTGVVLLFQPYLTAGGAAFLVAVAGSVAAAFAMVGLHQLRGTNTWAIVAHFSCLSSILAFICWTVAPENMLPARWDQSTALLLVAVGLFGAVGQFCITKAYAGGNPTRVGVVGLTEIVFAAILDMAIWGRSFAVGTVLGIVLILAATIWMTFWQSRPDKRSTN